MIIVVSGFAGSGKSTLAELLAEKYGLRCVHASGLLKKLQQEEVQNIENEDSEKNTGWWESEEGKRYLEDRLKDSSMDKKLDEALLKIADEDNVVFDSWTMAWLFKGNAFRVWLGVSPEVSAKRISGRDDLPVNELVENIKNRNEQTSKIYKNLYGFELGEDFKPFDLVLDTDPINIEQVFEKVDSELKNWLDKN